MKIAEMKENRKDTPNVPILRFPEFEREWFEKRFDEIYSFKTTNSYSRDNLNYEKGDVKNIHYGDIHTKFDSLFDIDKEEVPFINLSIETSKINEDCYLKKGDLVIADASENYNDIGKTIEIHNLNGEKVVAGLHTFLARRESTEMVDGFASFLMKTFPVRLEIMKIAQGIKVLGISKNRLDKIPLIIPSHAEQGKIAKFLAKINERISTQNKIIEHQESLMIGLMQQIFTQQLRFKPGASRTSAPNPLPEALEGNTTERNFPDWEVKKLGEIGRTYNGLTGKTKDDFGNGKSYIQYVQIFNNSKIDTTNFGLVSVSEDENQNQVKYGDVFFTTSSETPNEIGTSSVLIDHVEDCYLNSFCFGFRPYSLSELVPKFAQFFFRSETVRKEIVKLAQGSTRFNMSKVELMKLHFSFPCEEEQQKIANFLSAFDKKLEKEKQVLESYQQQKKYLLQNLFV